MDLKESLNLPDAAFTIPMKADLPKVEPEIQKSWHEADIYHLIQAARKDAPTFVLHDGPAYTNSPIHLGTALNKSLKDFVVKSRTMMGFRAPYVPGFDNHGLPIEQAAMKIFNEKKITPTATELREACRAHAEKFVRLQTEQFERFGVFGLWERPYKTMEYKFEAEILRVFKRLVEKGYVYKGLRPTLWSPTSRTALADTEIVYKDHTSTAIYVRFPLLEDKNGFSKGLPNLYTIIWTTTPWTIPANVAVAFNPAMEYAIVRVGADHYLIGHDLVEQVAAKLGWTDHEVLFVRLGASIEFAKFKHPIFDRESLAVLANYVTMEDGTGVVHTAPGHGRDDYYTGLRYNLPVLTPVDERGVLTAEAGEFEGTYYKDCDRVVVDRLREVSNLLDARPYSHSYPHAERDEQPVIFRATEQWFVSLEHDDLRKKMLAEVDRVEWFPKAGESRITAMVSGRPDWCVSRQRPWGCGIPVFYGVPSGEPVLDPIAIESVAKLVEIHGSDAWFEWEPSKILPPGYKHPKTGETEFRKETDTLDVWFDSGATSLCVLEGNVALEWKEPLPADMYLEGSDQHRGWFNSSLILSTALRGQAPYKQVVTHGFVTDENGLKFSKRLGNAIDPVKAAEMFGADVLRYWVASVDYSNDVPCSDALLKKLGDNYRNVRNTLRFLLINLYDYDASRPVEVIDSLDQWVMEQTDLLVADCVGAYERYDFNAVISGVHNFCRSELSSFYLDVIKDRMYCDAAQSNSRRSGQLAFRYVLERLIKLLAPVLPHTAEETWQRMQKVEAPSPGKFSKENLSNSVHLQLFDTPSAERLAEIGDNEIQERYANVLSTRSFVFTGFEIWKVGKDVKDSQDVIATIFLDEPTVNALKVFATEDLATLLKLSWVTLAVGEPAVEFAASPYLKSERSRLRRPDVELVDGVPLSRRDRSVVGV